MKEQSKWGHSINFGSVETYIDGLSGCSILSSFVRLFNAQNSEYSVRELHDDFDGTL
jgi:hypothetical protein